MLSDRLARVLCNAIQLTPTTEPNMATTLVTVDYVPDSVAMQSCPATFAMKCEAKG